MPQLDELFGVHGTDRAGIEPLLAPYEGMEVLDLPSSVTFEYRKSTDGTTAPAMYLKPDTSDGAPQREYLVDYLGYSKAMRLAGFAESVITKYPVEVMIDPLNYGFRNRVGEKVRAFVNGTQGGAQGHLVAFVKPTLELISTRMLVDKMLEMVGGNGLFERLDHDLSYTNCSMLVPFHNREWVDERIAQSSGAHAGMNDVICGGINFQTSIMGEKPLEVSGYIYRLICSNGLISAEAKFKWSRKTEATPLADWFGERVQACLDGLAHEFEKIDTMIKLTIPDGHRAQVMANVFQEYELSERIRHGVLARLADAPARHMWDVVNAITNVANDEEYSENPQTIRRLQSIGGDITTKMHICDSCHSVSRD